MEEICDLDPLIAAGNVSLIACDTELP